MMATIPTRLARVLASDPFTMGRDLDHVVQKFFGPTAGGPGVDVWETVDTVGVDIDLPGVAKEDVEVTVERSVLTINAERKAAQAPEGQNWLLNERQPYKFSRSFTLNSAVDGGSVTATLENGILQVRLAKREESKPRKITVA
jgi:HSP20 family protein